MLLSGLVLAVAIALFVIEPEARPFASILAVLATAAGLVGLADLLALGDVGKARLAGLALVLLALAFAGGAAALWADPSALPKESFPRIGTPARITVGLVGAAIFGSLGLLALTQSIRRRD